MKLVEVIVKTDIFYKKLFTYKTNKDVFIGQQILVPFGKFNELKEGYVFKIYPFNDDFDYEIKEIAFASDKNFLNDYQLELINSLHDDFLISHSDILKLILLKDAFKISVDYKLLASDIKIILDKLSLLKNEKYLTKKEYTIVNNKFLAYDIKTNIIKFNRISKKDINVLIKENLIKKDIIIKDNFFNDKEVFIKKADLNISDATSKLSKRATKQIEIIRYIYESNEYINLNILKKEFKLNSEIIDKFIKLNLIEIKTTDIKSKESFKGIKEEFVLNDEQEKIFNQIKNKNKSILHGITGSGKTFIYIKLAREIIKMNKQVLFLVPEISLTPQLISKFKKYFDCEIGVIHSKITVKEKYLQYKEIKNNKIKLIIGARSAIFSPINNLGMIIIDEFHENTFISDSFLRYSTLDIADRLADKFNAKIVLGSATPDISVLYDKKNEYDYFRLLKRFNDATLPKVSLVDMKKETFDFSYPFFSNTLIEKIIQRLKANEQTILLFNRVGFYRAIECKSCKEPKKCHYCDVSMVLYKNNIFKCPICDYKINEFKCLECGCGEYEYFSMGIEKVEELLKDLLNNRLNEKIVIKRLDSEVSSKAYINEIIDDMEEGKIDILIGTQMVTKGFDFKNLTLVGILNADQLLNILDYTAAERAYSMITQVSGRAGRHLKEGEVVIQGYNIENFSLISAINNDFDSFYSEELKIRERFGYPPFVDMTVIELRGEKLTELIDSADNIKRELERFFKKRFEDSEYKILGPSECVIKKMNNKFRYKIIVKNNKKITKTIKMIFRYLLIENKDKISKKSVNIYINFNQKSLL